MSARMWITHCFAGYFSISLLSLSTNVLRADSGFIQQSQLKSKYTINLASFDYNRFSYEPTQQSPSESQPFNLPDQDVGRFQRQAGKVAYKLMTFPQKKLIRQLGGAALLYGLDSLDMAAPLKNTLQFVKDKTRLNFGKCSQLRLSTKRLKAHSCFFGDKAKLEFQANYKMDSFKLNFNWSM